MGDFFLFLESIFNLNESTINMLKLNGAHFLIFQNEIQAIEIERLLSPEMIELHTKQTLPNN